MKGVEMPDKKHVGEFAEGEEKLPHHAEADDHTHFAEGQENRGNSSDKDHVGEFAEGEEKLPHRPEADDHTHFAEGQEATNESDS
jgi:hypothetical protein